MFTVVWHLAINVLLGTAFIDKHILFIRPNEQKVTLRMSTPLFIVEKHDVPANAVSWKKIRKIWTERLILRLKYNQRSTIKHSNTVRVCRQKFHEHLSVTQVVVTTDEKRLLNSGLSLCTQWGLPTNSIVETIPKCQFFSVVSNSSTKQQPSNKHKLLWYMNNDTCTIISCQAPLKSSLDE